MEETTPTTTNTEAPAGARLSPWGEFRRGWSFAEAAMFNKRLRDLSGIPQHRIHRWRYCHPNGTPFSLPWPGEEVFVREAYRQVFRQEMEFSFNGVSKMPWARKAKKPKK